MTNLTSKVMTTALALAATAGMASGGQNDSDTLAWYAAELLADSQTQSSWLGSSEYAPRVFGFLQARYNINHSDGFLGGEDITNGFEMARTRIGVKGQVHSRVGYYINGEFSADGGTSTLKDAFAWVKIDEGFKVKAGQFKLPFSRETLMSATRQLMVNSSTTESFFSLGRSQGVQGSWYKDRFRFHAAFSDGRKANNTVYSSAAEADWALTGRAEFLTKGTWEQFDDFTSWRDTDKGTMFGVALHWQDGGETNGTLDETYLSVTGDASLEWNGANLFAAGHWRKSELTAVDYTDYGFVVQGGYFLSEVVELIGRFDQVIVDDDRATGDDYSTVAVGFNYYMIPNSHAAKLTIEGQYFFDDDADSAVSTSTSLGSIPSTDSQFNLRAQLQIAF